MRISRESTLWTVAALALAAALAAGACAQKQDSGQGTVKGRALTPLAEDYVSVYREGMDLKGPPFTRSQPTGPAGDFTISLPPGKYFYVVDSRNGYPKVRKVELVEG